MVCYGWLSNNHTNITTWNILNNSVAQMFLPNCLGIMRCSSRMPIPDDERQRSHSVAQMTRKKNLHSPGWPCAAAAFLAKPGTVPSLRFVLRFPVVLLLVLLHANGSRTCLLQKATSNFRFVSWSVLMMDVGTLHNRRSHNAGGVSKGFATKTMLIISIYPSSMVGRKRVSRNKYTTRKGTMNGLNPIVVVHVLQDRQPKP